MQNTIVFSENSLQVLSNIVGDHTDPNFSGLVLRVTKNSNVINTSWYIRFQVHGRRFYRSIGTYPGVSISEARARAEICRRLLSDCFDIKGPFGSVINYHKNNRQIRFLWTEWCESEQRTGTSLVLKTYKDCLARGRNHIFSFIGNLSPNEVEANDVAEILNHCYESLSESTVKKIYLDINRFFKWCRAREFLDKNKTLPTQMDNLEVLVKKKSRRIHAIPHPALAQKDVSRFVKMLTNERFIFRAGVLPLLFTLLTASRIGNVVGSLNREQTQPMKWTDLNKGWSLWTIKQNNMKCGRHNGDHVVPLSDEARKVLVLAKLWQEHYKIKSEYIFTSKTGHRFDYRQIPTLVKRLSEICVQSGQKAFLDSDSGQIMHVHGLRSTFKSWGTNHGIDWTLTEIALHHHIDRLKYDRAKAINRRKRVMQQWANFCFSQVDINWDLIAKRNLNPDLSLSTLELLNN